MSEQYLRDAGTPDDPCWVPCLKGDPGAERFVSADTVAELREALELAARTIRHYGANQTEAGKAHPQQQVLDEIDTALNKSR